VKARYDVTHVSYEWAEFFKRLADDKAQNVRPLDQNGLDAKRFWRRLERIRLLIAVTYEEGGLPLVIRRALRKIIAIRRRAV